MMKPVKPLDRGIPDSRDHAKDGYSLRALENLIHDCQEQPDWRPRADLNVAYYDGKQLSQAQKWNLHKEDLEPRITNLISGVINSLLGQEAKSRSDVKVESDDDDFADVADVLSARLKEAQRETCADMAVSNAYGSQVKAGLGWVEVNRSQDPLDYPYRVADIHRNEIWYDWRAKDIGLKDARWLVRKRWGDLDEISATLPQFRAILENAAGGWTGFLLDDQMDETVLRQAWENERKFAVRRQEWVDGTRRRIKLYEVWYRVPAEAVVIHLGGGKRVLYDDKNPLHMEAVSRGLVKLSKALTRQVRMALFAGPHRLLDVATTKRNFPYIPFFAFRDDEDLSPYGLIDGMRSPQDEYNERRLRIQWMLRAQQIQVDNDALDPVYNSIAELADGAGRPDMLTVLNANRKNANALKIGNDLTLQKEQVDVMQDAKQLIQDVPRVYSTQLGNAPTGVTSGLAINSLVEQGMVSQGELNDNYRYARRMVFESLVELICEDHADENLRVQIGQGSTRRTVVLNSWDEQGMPVNRVQDAPVRTALSDVPSSPAFKLQQQQQIATIIGALAGNPQAVAVLTPAFVESSGLDNRQQIADDIRRLSNLPVSGDRAGAQEQQAQAKQQQAAQAQQQQQAAQIELADKAADVKRKNAQTELDQAKKAEIEQRMQIAANPPMQAANDDQLIQESLAEANG